MIALVAALKEEVTDILKAGSFTPLDAPGEALAYGGAVAGGPESIILLTGTGGARAEAATSWLLRTRRPQAVLSLGFAGGTKDLLAAGQLVLATEVALLEGTPFDWGPDSAGKPLSSDPAWVARARRTVEMCGIDFRQGRIISLPMLAKTSGLKRWTGETCGATAVDMESYRIGEKAAEAGVPFVCVRAVLDTVDVDLPQVVADMEGTPAGGRLLPMLAYAARHPRQLPSLVRLARATTRARRALTTFAVAFLQQAEPGSSGTRSP